LVKRENSVTSYLRNIQGNSVSLSLIEVDPNEVRLDPSNPRVGYSIRQLPEAERSDAACNLLLVSQEDTESLRRSIVRSGGVQEPIYLRADTRVAEGNRRVVAMRSLKEQFPEDPRFARLPAWLIPEDTPEFVIQDLLNEIHLGSVRGWAPYEKALQMRGLMAGGLIDDEVGERYRITAREVRQQLAAVDLMDQVYFPMTEDSTDPEHRAKFSYFLEYYKNGRIQEHVETMPDLPQRFCQWVRDGRLDTGASVRKLPKILSSVEATRLLEVVGFDAATEYLAKERPEEQELYAQLERTRSRLESMTVTELVELGESPDRQQIVEALAAEAGRVLETLDRLRRAS
jgi:hypothetical protein